MRLKKSLNLLDLFCIATGAMISSGLFVLPGLAFSKAGPAVVLSYLLAGLLCVPALLSTAELTTAMPKAGGDYFYIMRGFGPLLGTIAGLSTWFSLSLKGAFALLGIGAYLSVIIHVPLNTIALWFCLIFLFLNFAGVKEAGRLQVIVVIGLLGILITYILIGIKFVDIGNFSPFLPQGLTGMFATASFVFISYGGLIKIVAVAEEAKKPGRDLPLAMILSLTVTAALYALVIYVTVGVLEPQQLQGTLTPISDTAFVFGGNPLKFLIGIAALFAFISTANAGIMTASRYPLGMSRDKIFPEFLQKISPTFGTPYISVLLTGLFMVLSILFLKLDILVKVASSILILLFITANATLILFRVSKVASYRPKFCAPLYPYMQIIGIFGGVFLLIEMGTFIIALTGVFLFVGFLWYKFYVENKVSRDSALIYALERLVSKDRELTSDNILVELKDIVLERDEVTKDQFHNLIEDAEVLDIEGPHDMEYFFNKVSIILSKKLDITADKLAQQFIEREESSSTVISKGLAIPHIIINGENIFKIILARAKTGIIFSKDEVAHVIFVLVASADERNLHLKALSAIAQITQEKNFFDKWFKATSKDELKHIVLLAERKRF